MIVGSAAQICRVLDCRSGRVDLGHESVEPASRKTLESALRGKVGGVSESGDEGVAGAIHCHGHSVIVSASTQISGVGERGARAIQLREKRVRAEKAAAAVGGLHGASQGKVD